MIDLEEMQRRRRLEMKERERWRQSEQERLALLPTGQLLEEFVVKIITERPAWGEIDDEEYILMREELDRRIPTSGSKKDQED